MPRGRRVLVEGGLYHVYNRFVRGEGVFADPEEPVEFSELLREVKKRDGLTIYAWALLNKHPVAVSRWVSDAMQMFLRSHTGSGSVTGCSRPTARVPRLETIDEDLT